MKNNKIAQIVSILTILIIVIIVIITFINKMQELNKNKDENEITSASELVMIKDKIVKYETSTKNVSVIIPEFQNLDVNFGRYINLKIYNDLIDSTVYQNAIEGYETSDIGFFTYETNYERYNCADYLSIVANQYIHLGNGRPRIQKKCYILDAKNNASPNLVDLFVNKHDYKDVIIEEIDTQARNQNIELIGGNGLRNISDDQTFYIKDNKLIIYFEASEVAATAVGELEFVMPFEMVDGKFILPN